MHGKWYFIRRPGRFTSCYNKADAAKLLTAEFIGVGLIKPSKAPFKGKFIPDTSKMNKMHALHNTNENPIVQAVNSLVRKTQNVIAAFIFEI